MGMTDPIADFLNRIMNAQRARFTKVEIPASRVKSDLARILKEEGYIRDFRAVKDDKQGILQVALKYDGAMTAAIIGVKRISRPGCRVYVKHGDIPRVLNGLGTAILSTSRGIMTDRKAREEKVGGELLCKVW